MKIERGVITVGPRPLVSIDKNVHHCPVNTRSPAVAGMGRPFRDLDLTVSRIEETQS